MKYPIQYTAAEIDITKYPTFRYDEKKMISMHITIQIGVDYSKSQLDVLILVKIQTQDRERYELNISEDYIMRDDDCNLPKYEEDSHLHLLERLGRQFPKCHFSKHPLLTCPSGHETRVHKSIKSIPCCFCNQEAT